MKELKLNKLIRKNKSIILVLLILILGIFTVYASVTFSNSPSNYITADNLTINNSGFFGLSGKKLFTKSYDVVVCKGVNATDDENKKKSCDIVCLSNESDCYSKIQTAVYSLPNGGYIHFGLGTFPISQSINITSNSIILEGTEGNLEEPLYDANTFNGTAIIPSTSAPLGFYAFNIPSFNDGLHDYSGITIEKMLFFGKDTNNVLKMNAISAKGVQGLNIYNNVIFYSFGNAIYIISDGVGCDHNTVDKNYLMDTSGVGIWMYCYESLIINNELILPQFGIQSAQAIISNNWIDGANNISFLLGQSNTLSNNRIFSRSGQANVKIDGSNNIVYGNSLTNANYLGDSSNSYNSNIWIASGSNTLVFGNNFYDSGGYTPFFIYQSNGDNISIQNNNYYGNCSFGSSQCLFYSHPENVYSDDFIYPKIINNSNYLCSVFSPFYGKSIHNSYSSCTCMDNNWSCTFFNGSDPNYYSVSNPNSYFNVTTYPYQVLNYLLYLTYDSINNHTNDYSGNNYPILTINANWNATAGYNGYGAFNFSGTAGSYLSSTNKFISSNFTWCTWVKLNSLSAPSTQTFMANQGASRGGTLRYTNGNGLEFYVADGVSNTDIKTGVSVVVNSWNFICGTYGKNLIQIYKNGILLNSTIINSTSFTPDGATFTIGLQTNGTIDNTYIYNRTLSTIEILSIYNTIQLENVNSMYSSNDFIPLTNFLYNIGSSFLRWLKLWVQDIDASGTAQLNNTIINGTLTMNGSIGFTGSGITSCVVTKITNGVIINATCT